MRRNVVGLAVLAAVLATILFGVPLAVGVFYYYRTAERNELERIASSVAIDIPVQLLERPGQVELPPTPGATCIAVYDLAGRRLDGEGASAADHTVGDALRADRVAHDDEGRSFEVVVPLTARGRTVGAVGVISPKREVYEDAAVTWAWMVALAVVAVLITWLVAARLARKLAQPLEDLSTTARQLGEGDFSVVAPPSGVREIDSVGRSLNGTASRLAELVQRERAFSTQASHQLRTPLTGLRWTLEAALEDPTTDREATLAEALAAAERLERTVGDLLTLARESHSTRHSLELDGLVRERVSSWRRCFDEAGRAIETHVQDGVSPANASLSAVRQVLDVLVDNAHRHGMGTVQVTVRDASGGVAVDIADEGECAEFDAHRLLRTNQRDDDGHGIGLPLARALAQAEGGRITLARRSPTMFTLLLAVGAPEPEERNE